jgi:hypothetical protein
MKTHRQSKWAVARGRQASLRAAAKGCEKDEGVFFSAAHSCTHSLFQRVSFSQANAGPATHPSHHPTLTLSQLLPGDAWNFPQKREIERESLAARFASWLRSLSFSLARSSSSLSKGGRRRRRRGCTLNQSESQQCHTSH